MLVLDLGTVISEVAVACIIDNNCSPHLSIGTLVIVVFLSCELSLRDAVMRRFGRTSFATGITVALFYVHKLRGVT